MQISRSHIIAGVVVLTALVAGTASSRASGPKFFDDDPLWTEPVTQDVTNPSTYEPSLMYQTLEGLYAKPGDPLLGQRARDINTVDEVPDGPFYANRAGRMPLTPDIVARAANTIGPADGPWTVVSAKSDGITPGFTIRDRLNTMWFLKVDPPGWRGMATGSEVVAAKLFWAVGYHTVEYYLVRLQPSALVIGPKTTIEPPGEPERAMRQADIQRLLTKAEREADGSYRVIASKAAPGRPVGRLRFYGTRPDDPNDMVPAEHRRSLRGYRVFSAWLNHVDAKGINSLAVLVTENGRTFIRRYLLDFGSALGSGATGPRERWQGFEPLVETPSEIGKRVASFGARIPEWRRIDYFEAPAIGRLPRDHSRWNPGTWEPHTSNPAFRHIRADDAFWAARKLSFVTDDLIRAAIREGQFDDPRAEQVLAEALAARRDRILATYLPAVNPIVSPALEGDRLTFANAAVDTKTAPAPKGYRAEWFTFDNATGTANALATTEAEGTTLAVPFLPTAPDTFIRVNIAAVGADREAWAVPVSAYFRRKAESWTLVGFERLP
jgi:hypothetical protein